MPQFIEAFFILLCFEFLYKKTFMKLAIQLS